ncbi:hypothetical protein [Rhodococcus sp. OK302]|uniref:hypothetical protein n=1 Tax=Rhodococcus sp. OK302 TaxID=1882769 RepID=UPI0015952A1F|nr:hypothetical protein [Rhodococcus sp. OK302]
MRGAECHRCSQLIDYSLPKDDLEAFENNCDFQSLPAPSWSTIRRTSDQSPRFAMPLAATNAVATALGSTSATPSMSAIARYHRALASGGVIPSHSISIAMWDITSGVPTELG